MLDQRDVDGELAVALDELAGAVKRVNQEKPFGGFRNTSGRDFFLGDHRDIGKRGGQRLQDHSLGTMVGLGDRRTVAFADMAKGGVGIDGHDLAAGGKADIDQNIMRHARDNSLLARIGFSSG